MTTLLAFVDRLSKRQLALALVLSLATIATMLVIVGTSPGPCVVW